MWVQIFPSQGTEAFVKIYHTILKDNRFQYPSTGATVSFINKSRTEKLRKEITETYKIELQWQSEDICGVDILKNLEDKDVDESIKSNDA